MKKLILIITTLASLLTQSRAAEGGGNEESIYGRWTRKFQLVDGYTFNMRQTFTIERNYVVLEVNCSVDGAIGGTSVTSDSSTQIEPLSDGKSFYLKNIYFQGMRKEYKLHLFFGPTMFCYIGESGYSTMGVQLLDSNTLKVYNYDGSISILKRD